jgi:hypothetical protein
MLSLLGCISDRYTFFKAFIQSIWPCSPSRLGTCIQSLFNHSFTQHICGRKFGECLPYILHQLLTPATGTRESSESSSPILEAMARKDSRMSTWKSYRYCLMSRQDTVSCSSCSICCEAPGVPRGFPPVIELPPPQWAITRHKSLDAFTDSQNVPMNQIRR